MRSAGISTVCPERMGHRSRRPSSCGAMPRASCARQATPPPEVVGNVSSRALAWSCRRPERMSANARGLPFSARSRATARRPASLRRRPSRSRRTSSAWTKTSSRRGTSPIGPPHRCHTGNRASCAGIALPLLGSAASATPSRRTRGAVSHDDGAGTSASVLLSQQVAQQRLEVTAIAVGVFRE